MWQRSATCGAIPALLGQVGATSILEAVWTARTDAVWTARTDAGAEALQPPFARIAGERLDRGRYHFRQAPQRRAAQEPVP